MELATVPCNNCGASIQIAESTRFVACKNCCSHLSIVRTDSCVFTEPIKLETTLGEPVAQAPANGAYKRELDHMDREWQLERQIHLRSWYSGALSDDSIGVTKFLWALATIVCSIGAVVFLFVEWFFAGLLVMMAIVSAFRLMRIIQIQRDLSSAETAYKQRRAAIRPDELAPLKDAAVK